MTREMKIAVERAAKAAETDPLVEALEAMRIVYVQLGEYREGDGAAKYHARNIARAVLAKYAPDRAGGGE